MSYLGSKFPEGIDSGLFKEVTPLGTGSAQCPHLRQAVIGLLSSRDSASATCPGCHIPDSARIYIAPETERLFVRRELSCVKNKKT